jgi:16S rRNA (cytosine967-C5)-methyltransferase
MKLTRPLAATVVQVLKEVLIHNRYGDKSLERMFKTNPQLSLEDRGFIAETSYDIIRFYRMLEKISESKSLWKLLGAWMVWRGYDLNNWKEFASLSQESIRQNYQLILSNRKIRESIPDWLDELGEQELGGRWDSELKALNLPPLNCLRVNTLKTTLPQLQSQLADEGYSTTTLDGFPEALVLTNYKSIFQSAAFKDGLVEVQDAGSQSIVPFLHVKPGQRVIDACAGAGGKTLHLAAHMQNKGRLIALDVAGWKLDELKNRARRAGVHNFETKVIDTNKTIKRQYKTADRLLLDVPCSGLGVLKRNPDAKWKLKPEYITRIMQTQQHILEHYAPLVKVGGFVVYSTCSILPSENERQVKQFLGNHASTFALEEEKHLFPSAGFDGFYMARLKRLS